MDQLGCAVCDGTLETTQGQKTIHLSMSSLYSLLLKRLFRNSSCSSFLPLRAIFLLCLFHLSGLSLLFCHVYILYRVSSWRILRAFCWPQCSWALTPANFKSVHHALCVRHLLLFLFALTALFIHPFTIGIIDCCVQLVSSTNTPWL